MILPATVRPRASARTDAISPLSLKRNNMVTLTQLSFKLALAERSSTASHCTPWRVSSEAGY